MRPWRALLVALLGTALACGAARNDPSSGYAIHITSPAPDAAVVGPMILVRGTVRQPSEGGSVVVVQGKWPDEIARKLDALEGRGERQILALVVLGGLAVVADGQFAARAWVEPGATTITATIRTLAGREEARHEITVQASEGRNGMLLHVTPEDGGVAPLTVEIDEGPVPTPWARELDFEGDGTVDSPGDPGGTVSHTYAAPGIYVPTLTLRRPDGTIAERQWTLVEVIPRPPDLSARWARFVAAIRAGDLGGALEYVASESRDHFRKSFAERDDALVASISTQLRLVKVDSRTAECEEVRDTKGSSLSYPVKFVREYDGVWRIRY